MRSALWSRIPPRPLPRLGLALGGLSRAERARLLSAYCQGGLGDVSPKPRQAREGNKAEPLQADAPSAPFRIRSHSRAANAHPDTGWVSLGRRSGRAQPGLGDPPETKAMTKAPPPPMLPCQLHLSCRKSDPRPDTTWSASVLMQAALSSLCIPLTESTLKEIYHTKHHTKENVVVYTYLGTLCPGAARKAPPKRRARRAGSHVPKSCVPASSQALSAGPLLQVCICRAEHGCG